MNVTEDKRSPKTLVVGGSTKPERFSFRAIQKLVRYGHEVVSIGLRGGEVSGVRIWKERPAFEDIDTVTMYVGPERQPEIYGYLLGLKPRRIIFNPGTENGEFERMAHSDGIETIRHCTLVMLDQGEF